MKEAKICSMSDIDSLPECRESLQKLNARNKGAGNLKPEIKMLASTGECPQLFKIARVDNNRCRLYPRRKRQNS